MNWVKALLVCLVGVFQWAAHAETVDVHLDSLRREAGQRHDIKSYANVCVYLSDIEQHPDILLLYADSLFQLAHSEPAGTGVMDYYSFRAEACFMVGNYEEGFSWKRKAIDLAKWKKNNLRYVSYAADMGYYYNVAAVYDSARYYLRNGMRVAERYDSMRSQLHLMQTNFVSSFLYQGKSDSALVYAHEAERCCALDKDTVMWLENLNQLGTLYRRMKQMDKAIYYFEIALRLAEQQKNLRLATFIYGNIATAYCEWQRKEDAIAFSEKALDYALKYGTPQMQGIFYVNLGVIQCNLPSMRKQGIASLQKAIPLLEQVNNKRRLCEVYTCLTNVYIDDNKLSEAEMALSYLDSLSGELQTDVERYRYYGAKASFMKKQKQYAEALVHYQNMLDMQRKGYRDSKDYECYLSMAQCWLALKQECKALECMQTAYALRDTAFSREHMAQLSDFSVKYKMQEKELEIARLREKEWSRSVQLYRIRVVAGTILAVLTVLVLILLYLRQRQRAHMALLAQAASEKEQQFLTLQKETERRLTQKYIEGLEMERARMAAELHDDVCNSLLAVTMNMQNVLQDECNSVFSNQLRLLENTRERLRHMSHELMPPAFQYATLDEMLYDYASHLQLSLGTQLIYHSTEGVDWNVLPENIVLTFYRIVQEALSNALKYAAATVIQVDLLWENNTLSVRVKDNGNGFDMTKRNKGIGLLTIKRRADSVGAVATCISALGKGTEIYVAIKLEKSYGSRTES